MQKPETLTFGVTPESRKETGVNIFKVELFENEVKTLCDFIKNNGPEAPIEDLKKVDSALYEQIIQAIPPTNDGSEAHLLWPEDIIVDCFPEYFECWFF